MIYNYHSKDFFKTYLKLNNIQEEDLDTSSFIIDNSDEHLSDFKIELLSLRNKKVLIVGDYDCDGICSTTIIKRLLDYLNINSNFYIPKREKDGYGINENIIKMAHDNNFEAILMVDNGVSATEQLSLCKKLNIKTLIIDHHEYNEKPLCDCFIHPNLLNAPYNNLSAGGLSYLVSTLFYEDELSLILGGLATYGDMVGVLGFNRYLIKRCVELLNSGRFYQISLLNDNKPFDYESLSFNVIPKINAINRMNNNPNILVKYFLADKSTCLATIDSINKINIQRKEYTTELIKEAEKLINNDNSIAYVISEKFTEGLCGLLANRLLNELNKPIIVFTKKDGLLKGSCRSIDGFNLYEYLINIKDIFDTFGGHELALGLSLNEENLPKLIEYITNNKIEYKPVVKDVYLLDENILNYDFYTKIDALKPFGSDLKEPLFAIDINSDMNKTLMANKYFKCFINDEVSAISFNNDHSNIESGRVIGTLKKDNFGVNKANLIIEDLV